MWMPVMSFLFCPHGQPESCSNAAVGDFLCLVHKREGNGAAQGFFTQGFGTTMALELSETAYRTYNAPCLCAQWGPAHMLTS